MVVSRPKVSFGPHGSSNPGNYGWLSILAVQLFRAADCDTDLFLVVAKVRERPTVNNQRSHRFSVDMFNLLISFILHSVNPYKVCNLSDIELVMI
jgi:hypothetical protein